MISYDMIKAYDAEKILIYNERSHMKMQFTHLFAY